MSRIFGRVTAGGPAVFSSTLEVGGDVTFDGTTALNGDTVITGDLIVTGDQIINNIVTEDLVFLLESQGLRTGVNFERLFAARGILAEALPEVELYGFTPAAGLPRDFVAATPQ